MEGVPGSTSRAQVWAALHGWCEVIHWSIRRGSWSRLAGGLTRDGFPGGVPEATRKYLFQIFVFLFAQKTQYYS